MMVPMPNSRESDGPDITAFERLSAPYLIRLHSVPRWLLAIVLAGLLVTALFVNGVVGAILLFAIALFLGWLVAVGWRLMTPASRLIRLLVVALLVWVGLSQLS
jgi:hypothetical protein